MRYIFILLALLCASCGTALPTIKPYKLDVQQGNVVTSKMLLQLRPGMTKSQVRFIMGTPLIQDSFHGNRWDYVYQMREGGKIKEQRRVILDFENELLKSVRGDVIPAGTGEPKAGESEAVTGTRVVTPIKKPEEKSLMNKLKFWEKDEAELAKEKAEKEAAAKARLEAEEAAKKAAASPAQSSAKPSAEPAAEESKSLLAVPLAAPASEVPAAPAAEAAAPLASPAVETAPAPVPPPVAAPDVIQTPPAEVSTQKPAAPEQPAPATPNYDSASGMQFDRQLRSAPEEAEAEVKPGAPEPRAGNKTVPKPKDLPNEGDPGFFDRMLEKIGF